MRAIEMAEDKSKSEPPNAPFLAKGAPNLSRDQENQSSPSLMGHLPDAAGAGRGGLDRSLITQQKVSNAKLARAKEMRSEPTAAEHKLWQQLRANRLEGLHFRRQQVIEPYIVDFYCHKTQLVIEVDGGIHLEQEVYDCQREQDLKARGLRFTNREVLNNLDTVLTEILRACRREEN